MKSQIKMPIKKVKTEEKTPPKKEVKAVKEKTPVKTVAKEKKPPVVEETAPVVEAVEYGSIGIQGENKATKTFRALCKYHGKKVNTVLTELLIEWNAKNPM